MTFSFDAVARRRPTGWPILLAAVLLFAWAMPALAAPADVPGWRAARWGMSEAELQAAFPGALTRLAEPRVYGHATAPLALLDTPFAGLDFDAFFQMNEASGRLQQVLLERRRPLATPADFERLLSGLRDAYGDPAESCLSPRKPGGEPLRYELIWRFATSTLHASFLDFSSTEMMERDPALPLDTYGDLLGERQFSQRSVPRRILFRAHPAERTDLAPPCG